MRRTATAVLGIIALIVCSIPAYPQTIRDSQDSEFNIMIGRASGVSYVNKFGRNVAVAATDEVIWDGSSATWAAPTVSRTHQITSADPNDDVGDNGATAVTIYGLDANYALASEVVAMNGTANVGTGRTYTMIYRMVVTAVGGTGYNEGIITATADTDTTVTAQINAGNNQTLMAIYMIPAGKTGYLTSYYSGINKDATPGTAVSSNIELWVKPFGEANQIKHVVSINTAGTSQYQHDFRWPLAIAAKSIVSIEADPSASEDISAGFEIVLVDD